MTVNLTSSLYPAKLSSQHEARIKTFSDTQRLRKHIALVKWLSNPPQHRNARGLIKLPILSQGLGACIPHESWGYWRSWSLGCTLAARPQAQEQDSKCSRGTSGAPETPSGSVRSLLFQPHIFVMTRFSSYISTKTICRNRYEHPAVFY